VVVRGGKAVGGGREGSGGLGESSVMVGWVRRWSEIGRGLRWGGPRGCGGDAGGGMWRCNRGERLGSGDFVGWPGISGWRTKCGDRAAGGGGRWLRSGVEFWSSRERG